MLSQSDENLKTSAQRAALSPCLSVSLSLWGWPPRCGRRSTSPTMRRSCRSHRRPRPARTSPPKSVDLSLSLCLSVSLPLCLSVCLSLPLSLSVSVSEPLWPSRSLSARRVVKGPPDSRARHASHTATRGRQWRSSRRGSRRRGCSAPRWACSYPCRRTSPRRGSAPKVSLSLSLSPSLPLSLSSTCSFGGCAAASPPGLAPPDILYRSISYPAHTTASNQSAAPSGPRATPAAPSAPSNFADPAVSGAGANGKRC